VAAHVTKLVLVGAFATPTLGEREVIAVSDVPFERMMIVSYRLSTVSVVTTALSLTIWPQFDIECLQRSNQHRRVVHFEAKFGEEGVDHVVVSQILMQYGERQGLSYIKEIVDLWIVPISSAI